MKKRYRIIDEGKMSESFFYLFLFFFIVTSIIDVKFTRSVHMGFITSPKLLDRKYF